jgi:hypothetical protein
MGKGQKRDAQLRRVAKNLNKHVAKNQRKLFNLMCKLPFRERMKAAARIMLKNGFEL